MIVFPARLSKLGIVEDQCQRKRWERCMINDVVISGAITGYFHSNVINFLQWHYLAIIDLLLKVQICRLFFGKTNYVKLIRYFRWRSHDNNPSIKIILTIPLFNRSWNWNWLAGQKGVSSFFFDWKITTLFSLLTYINRNIVEVQVCLSGLSRWLNHRLYNLNRGYQPNVYPTFGNVCAIYVRAFIMLVTTRWQQIILLVHVHVCEVMKFWSLQMGKQK